MDRTQEQLEQDVAVLQQSLDTVQAANVKLREELDEARAEIERLQNESSDC